MVSFMKFHRATSDQVKPGRDPANLDAYDNVDLNDEYAAEIEAPLLLLVGSLTDCSKKDAIAYCKGLIDQHVMAQESAGYRILKERHGEAVRYLYEVHEGGPGKSILPRVLDAAKQAGSVKLRLAQGRIAEVMEVNGEVLTLIHTAESDIDSTQVTEISSYSARTGLTSALGTGAGLIPVGAALAGLSLLYLGGCALAYFVMNQDATLQTALQRYYHVPAPVKYDGLAVQLLKAKSDADRKHEPISFLQFKAGKWAWGLGEQKANDVLAPSKPIVMPAAPVAAAGALK